MNKNLLPALVGIALTAVLAAAPAEAQDACDGQPADSPCGIARALRTEMDAMTECNASNQARVLELGRQISAALTACEARSALCARALAVTVDIINNGCGGSAIAAAPNEVCEGICTARSHGTWCAAGDGRPECQCPSGRAGRHCRNARRTDAAWCRPADGYRIASRCRPVVVRRTPPPDPDRPPPPPPGTARCNTGIDADGDGVSDLSEECLPYDNCRLTPNADQADRDTDGEGDACDDDDDLAAMRLRYTADAQQLCLDVGERAPSCVTLRQFVEGGEPPVPGPFIDEWARGQIRDILIELNLLDAATQCLMHGRRFGRVTRERSPSEDEVVADGGTVIREEHLVCLETCVDSDHVYSPLTEECEPRSEANDDLGLEVALSAGYMYFVDHAVIVEASVALPLTDDQRLRLRGWIAGGVSPASQHHDTALVGVGGAGIEYAVVDEDSVRVILGVGGFGLGSMEADSGRNPFAGGGGYVEGRIEIGPRDGPNFFLRGRGMGGACDTSWSNPDACFGGSVDIGVSYEW